MRIKREKLSNFKKNIQKKYDYNLLPLKDKTNISTSENHKHQFTFIGPKFI